MSIYNYELLNILSKETNSCQNIFKVKNKSSGEYYVWNVISPHNPTILEEKFKLRKYLEHPNLLELYELLREPKSHLYYLVVRYCRHGSLKDLVDLAFRDGSHICEEFLCKILYQIALVVKTINTVAKFDVKDIFFDEDYNVKLFNFNVNGDSTKAKGPKMSSLGEMIFEVSTLTQFKKGTFEKELKKCTNFYSKTFLSLITSMIKDGTDLKKNIDRILCNSALLLKVTLWNKQKLLIKINEINNCMQIPEKSEEAYTIQIEKLLENKLTLEQKEKELNEREYKIAAREKKIDLMENKLKDNLKRVDKELLKYKSNIKCNCNTVSTIKEATENLDSTYISCGDSVIPTSKKLNVNEIVKPATFTRTLSEKRIKFKGHSPLKDIDFNRRRSLKYPKTRKVTNKRTTNNEWISCSDDTDKSALTYQKSMSNRGKQLFNAYEKDMLKPVANSDAVKPIKWTEENKRHAFDLLRLMNSDKENKPPDIKHTYL